MFFIFAQNLEIAEQGAHGFDSLTVADEIVECQVDVEAVLPLAADDGRRMDFCQIYIVERQDGKYL